MLPKALSRAPVRARPLHTLLDRIAALGLAPGPLGGRSGCVVGAATAGVRLQTLFSGETDSGAIIAQIASGVTAGVPVSIALTEFGAEPEATTLLRQFCESLAGALRQRGQSPAGIATVIHSHALPLEAYELITRATLGPGPRHVFLDSLQLTGHCDADIRRRTDANWILLRRRSASSHPLLPVYGGIVRSACPLLSDEAAAVVQPASALYVPRHSAWFPLSLSLPRFADRNGTIDWSRLRDVLESALPLADRCIEHLEWPDRDTAADARYNRRIAIRPTGLGELVRRRKEVPSALQCLRRLDREMLRIDRILVATTARMAERDGAIPALSDTSPVDDWPCGPHRESWQRRWQIAIRKTAVRNRNLLVMSPYDVLPDEDGHAGYADLLPVIAHAHAWCFPAPQKLAGFSLKNFSRFHRRARAIIQGGNRISLIADGA